MPLTIDNMNDLSIPFASFRSRLPEVGTTIFSTMSALAARHQAVNLGQGFPDFDCDPTLLDAVDRAMRDGHNQYPPMSGVPALRQAVAEKIATLYGATYDAESEITITAGATQALLTAMLCCLHPGDEVIVIEPAFDSYLPAIALAGARALTVPMHYDGSSFCVAWERVAEAVSPRTRLILINTPHNPTGSILSDADMQSLAAIVAGTDILILSDEVYEHMVYDGAAHASVARYPDLAARSMVVGSFGKTFHVTGWKVGYVAAPAWLTAEFRKVHQFNVFTVNTPMQYALAHYLENPRPYLALSSFYQAKRDLFRDRLASSRLRLLPSCGTYFQCADFSAVSSRDDAEFARWLTTDVGVAAIPLSAFYREPRSAPSGIIRFCFAKKDATLLSAVNKLLTV